MNSKRWLGVAGAVLATALQIYVFVAESAFIYLETEHTVGGTEGKELASSD